MGTKTTIWDFIKLAGLLFIIGCIGVIVMYATIIAAYVVFAAAVITVVYVTYTTIVEIYLLIMKKIRQGRKEE